MKRNELKKGDLVRIVLRDIQGRAIPTTNTEKVFEVVQNGARLGVNWNSGKYADIYGEFVALDGFAPYPATEFIKLAEPLEIRIIYEDGTEGYTKINATETEARAYYVGKIFNVGTVCDVMKKCVNIEII